MNFNLIFFPLKFINKEMKFRTDRLFMQTLK